MTAGAADVDPAAIEQAARALVRYADAEGDVMAKVAEAQQRVQAAIAAAISERTRQVEQARRALDHCRARKGADCSALARAVSVAEERLAKARQASHIANAAAGRFAPAQARHSQLVAALVTAGRARLGRKSFEIGAYTASSATSAIPPASGGLGNGTSGGRVAGTPAGFPAGWAMVPLSRIDLSDNAPITGPADFGKGYSPEDFDWVFDALHDVVMPAMAAGKGSDYFAERDAREGRYGSRSYSDTYSGFFHTDNSIVLNQQPDGSYRVTNGRHRIWVAARRGEAAIPAQVLHR